MTSIEDDLRKAEEKLRKNAETLGVASEFKRLLKANEDDGRGASTNDDPVSASSRLIKSVVKKLTEADSLSPAEKESAVALTNYATRLIVRDNEWESTRQHGR